MNFLNLFYRSAGPVQWSVQKLEEIRKPLSSDKLTRHQSQWQHRLGCVWSWPRTNTDIGFEFVLSYDPKISRPERVYSEEMFETAEESTRKVQWNNTFLVFQ
jgi:hypothetical protein